MDDEAGRLSGQERVGRHQNHDSNERSSNEPDRAAQCSIQPRQAHPFEELRCGVAQQRADRENAGEDRDVAKKVGHADRTGVLPQRSPGFGVVDRREEKRKNRRGQADADARETFLKSRKYRDEKGQTEDEGEVR